MATIKKNVNLEFGSASFNLDELEKKVMETVNKENSAVKEVNLYIKPEDNKVYYTVNNSNSGSMDM